MTELTKEYLQSIGFNPEPAQAGDLTESFVWSRTVEGSEYWAGLPEAQHKRELDDMLRVWHGFPRQPVEYVLTIGEGRVLSYGCAYLDAIVWGQITIPASEEDQKLNVSLLMFEADPDCVTGK